MLTTDLLRVRSVDGELRPRYLDPADPVAHELAAQLIAVFADHVGEPRWKLDAALRDLLGTGTAFLLHRGLAKLLADRAELDTAAVCEPEELRRRVFAAAAAARRATGPGEELDRAAILAAVAAELDSEVGAVERSLYADLKDEQILVAWESCTPEWLLQRYNVALAQAILLRAESLDLYLRGGASRQQRAIFQRIKFFQLMHTVGRGEGGGWQVRLDGPTSLFRASTRYGLQMASFLPTLLHVDDWSLEAVVRWGKRRLRRRFVLSAADGLRPHGRLPGQWQPEELVAFAASFRAQESDWEIDPQGALVDLGGESVLVPDFVFLHRPTGVEVVMEVLGYWRRGAVKKRLALLRRHGPENLVLAVSKQLAAGEDELEGLPGPVYVFTKTPLVREVVKRLEPFVTGGAPGRRSRLTAR